MTTEKFDKLYKDMTFNTGTIEACARLVRNFTSIEVMREYQEMTGECHDWHKFSNYLEELACGGFVKIVGCKNGRAQYSIDVW